MNSRYRPYCICIRGFDNKPEGFATFETFSDRKSYTLLLGFPIGYPLNDYLQLVAKKIASEVIAKLARISGI